MTVILRIEPGEYNGFSGTIYRTGDCIHGEFSNAGGYSYQVMDFWQEPFGAIRDADYANMATWYHRVPKKLNKGWSLFFRDVVRHVTAYGPLYPRIYSTEGASHYEHTVENVANLIIERGDTARFLAQRCRDTQHIKLQRVPNKTLTN
jgi:hypothetical protein